MDKNTKFLVGDYVMVTYKGEKVIGTIHDQSEDLVGVLINDEIEDYYIIDVSGIELTEQFLDKNSYRVYHNPYFVQYCIDNIYTIKEIYEKFYFNSIELKYVHEFQHWLNFCHIDKEIEL